MAPLRWGICATGLIAHDFATALSLNKDAHEIVAIGGRTPQKVQDFAAKFNVKNQFNSVEELAECPEVQVVYVSSLTNLHYQHVKLYLTAGKHVLCEKPMTLAASESRELIELAQSKKVFLMLGMWSRFFPSHQKLQSVIQSGELGEVRILNACFCMPGASGVERLNNISMGGGIMADFGVYLVNIACWVFKSQRPLSISAVGHQFDSGADRSAVVTLKYSDNKMASLTFSPDVGPYAKAVIIGEKGVAELGDLFWCATKLKVNDQETEVKPPGSDKEFRFWNSGGLLYEANHVKECLDKGLIESPIMTHSDCQLIHEILDEGYRQLGVHYPSGK